MQQLFRAGFFIDGTGCEVKRDVYFAVAGGRIGDIGRRDDFAAADAEAAADFSEYSVLPGLIDGHAHLFMEGVFDLKERSRRRKEEGKDETLIRGLNNFARARQNGVTTVRDLGGSFAIGSVLKKAAAQKMISGVRVLTAHQAISITGGHFYYAGGREADGAAEVVKAVREQVKKNADLIKFMLTGCVNFVREDAGFVEYSPPETEALIKEAHALGRKVAVHANGVKGVRQALSLGVDTLEHGALLDEETVDLVCEKEVYWLPTLLPFQRMLDYSLLHEVPSLPRAGLESVYHRHLAMVARAVKNQAKIVAGTDAGALGVEHGDVWRELALLVKCGMKNTDAVRAATSLAAEALGISHDTGSLTPGKRADFIAVSGNAAADITCLQQVKTVFQNGSCVYNSP
ncbi:MAG: amidohydrolase family protein [Sporomusaceae bacterium]|jgi:imidazolonepropionase-like amidohydrolase|nr:amidohydrolase family protein [Sporomusaceae bacterium]